MKIARMAAAALGVLFMSASLAQAAAPPVSKLQIGSKMEPFTLKDLEGNDAEVKFDKKVNVLSFWVSTCTLCKAELKTINELAVKNPDVGFTVVSTDFGGAKLVKYVLKETGTETKVPILLDQLATIATKKYGVSRFPFLAVINKDGVVQFVSDGWEAESAARIEKEIEFRKNQ